MKFFYLFWKSIIVFIVYYYYCFKFRFLRELVHLKQIANYESCDQMRLDDWLKEIGPEFRQYTYQMVMSGVDMRVLRLLTDEHLLKDCGIQNGIHRLKIIESAKREQNNVSFLYYFSPDIEIPRSQIYCIKWLWFIATMNKFPDWCQEGHPVTKNSFQHSHG